MVIISQDCDLVADPAGEPLAEAIPVVRLPKEETLPAANSARYFTLDAEARLVADLTRRLSFEKALLPDRDAEHYFDDEGTAERFRAWCARRYSRVPLPDDFNLVVAGALDRAWSKRGRATDSRAQAMYPWRVILSETEAGVDTAFLVPFDEDRAEEAEVQSLTNALIADAQKRLAKQHEWARRRFGQDVGIRDFTISAAQARPSAAVSLRALMKLPPLALEHLTYAGEEIIGTEPRAEQLS